MNLKEIQDYWQKSSLDALDSAVTLVMNKKFVHGMFFLHLAVEKMLKALIVNHRKEEAPYGHNLLSLANQISELNISRENLELLAKITEFNIAARYDDYKFNFYKLCTKDFSEMYLMRGKELVEWLRSRLK